MNKQEIRELIHGLDLFKDCGDIPFEKALFDKGDRVSDSLNGIPCVGIVASGELEVSPSGRRTTVSTLKAGDVFGICNILAGEDMPTSLVCKKHATVAYITKDDFVGLLRRDPEFAIRYATLCNEKILFLARRVAFGDLSSSEEKLRVFLARNAQNGKVTVSSKEDLARRLGISHAALFRGLHKLQKSGKITVEDTVITVLEEL